MKRRYSALKPGWKMTEAQWLLFWRLWGNACRTQGWDKSMTATERDVKRQEILVGLGFSSAKLIDSTAGFDRVKKRLEELADRVHNPDPEHGQVPSNPPSHTSAKRKTEVRGEAEGDRRRLLFRIGEVAAELNGAGYPAALLESILKDFGVVPGVRDIADLSADRLLTLSRTLTARLDQWQEGCQDDHDTGKALDIDEDLTAGEMVGREEGFSAMEEEGLF